MPEAYERWLVPTVFRPFADEVGGWAAARRPRRVLELAAGTGVLTRELRARCPDAHIVATDLNAAMVDYGQRQVPDVSWQQADALQLPFDDGAFDLVVCQFGVMFFPDKVAGFEQARRVLTPDGSLLFTTWGAVETHDFGHALVTALGRVFPEDPPAFLVAVPHGYADAGTVAADLHAAGFTAVDVEAVTLEGRAESVADVTRGFCTGSPLWAEIAARGDAATLTEEIAAEVVALLGPGPVTGRMTAHVVVAQP